MNSTPESEPVAAVVVPMYGVRAFIDDCLHSIAGQSIADRLEVILVDDGSTDGTAEIATSFVARHPSWTLLWQPNAGPGPGAARNRGLMEVKSDYVLFCDGDDMLEPQALERLVDAAAATSDDIVVGASRQFPSSRRWRWSHLFEPLDDVCRAGSVNDFPDLVHHPAPGDKLFRTAYLRESGLRFGERIHHQDTLVSIPALLRGARVTVQRSAVQLYRHRGDGSSIMDGHYTREQNTWDHLLVVQRLASLREELPPDRVALLDAFLLRSFQGFVARAPALSRDGAERLFAASRAIFAPIAPRLVLDLTDGAVHALAYRALMIGDLDLFLDPARGIVGLDLSSDGIRLVAPAEPPWDEVLVLGRLRSELTSIEVDRGDLVLGGTVRVSGSPALAILPAEVMVRLRGAGITVPARLEPADGAAALTVSTFEARVPLGRLTDGQFDLRIVLQDGEAQRSGRMALHDSASHPVVHEGLRLNALVNAEGAAALEVAGVHPPEADVEPRTSRLRRFLPR